MLQKFHILLIITLYQPLITWQVPTGTKVSEERIINPSNIRTDKQYINQHHIES